MNLQHSDEMLYLLYVPSISCAEHLMCRASHVPSISLFYIATNAKHIIVK
jgi:hypothetical protein